MHDVRMEDVRFEARAPQGGEVLALLVIVPAVAAVARMFDGHALFDPWAAAMAVGLWAGTIGLPALVWAFEHGRTGVGALAATGVVAGLVPPVLLCVSGVLGLFIWGDAEYVGWVLGKGASIPIYGVISWPSFLRLTGWSVMIGAGSAVIFRLLVLSARTHRARSWMLAATTLTVVAGTAFWLGK